MVVKYLVKAINENPKEYFTDEILQRIEDCAQKEFLYGGAEQEELDHADTSEA